ncbi:hypothetical protein ACH492_38495 [Streptomyces sp. NPDC019443]|uniref:hypothetical protein n=1 Tax=Streptomyces sp. NPDC019443 TaxID=3365061 RepID=UPI0037971EBE
MLKRARATLAALLAVIAAMAMMASSPAAAAPGGSDIDIDGMPSNVQEKIAQIEEGGGHVRDVHSAPFTPTDARSVGDVDYRKSRPMADTSSSDEPSTKQFPTGCGLWVIVYDQGYEVFNSSLTSCRMAVDEIQMLAGLAGTEDFLWWDEAYWTEEAQDEDGATFTSSLPLDISYHCAGDGNRHFRGVTNGYVEIGGRGFQASAYDQIENKDCG